MKPELEICLGTLKPINENCNPNCKKRCSDYFPMQVHTEFVVNYVYSQLPIIANRDKGGGVMLRNGCGKPLSPSPADIKLNPSRMICSR